MKARAAAERIVGFAMLGVEEVILLEETGKVESPDAVTARAAS